MKKSIVVLCFLFVATASNNVFGQSRIGSTLNQISSEFTKKEFPDQGIALNRNGGGYYMFLKTWAGDVIYFADEDSICTRCVLIPSSDSSFTHFIQVFNKKSEIIDNRTWVNTYAPTGLTTLIKIIEDDLEGYNSTCGSYFEFTSLN